MDQLKLGDEVLIASLDGKNSSFSPVIAMPHPTNSHAASFVLIETVTGRQVKMTASHLLLGGACSAGATDSSSMTLTQASAVKVGSCVQTLSGEEAVASVGTVPGRGVYTAVTKSGGLLVVNGIVASPFAVSHHVFDFLYNIHRMVDNVSPSLARSQLAVTIIKAMGDVLMSIY